MYGSGELSKRPSQVSSVSGRPWMVEWIRCQDANEADYFEDTGTLHLRTITWRAILDWGLALLFAFGPRTTFRSRMLTMKLKDRKKTVT